MTTPGGTPAATVAVVGSVGVAPELAKRSTQSDVTLFHLLQEGLALSLVEPTQHPEKYPPLLYALAMSDRALFIVNALDRAVAETAATLDLFDLPVEIRHGPAVGPEEIARAFRGLRLASAPVAPLDLVRLREEILRPTPPRPAGPVIAEIDHAFPVKGVGPVALGFVRQGTLSAHGSYRLYPTDRTVEVRSIQVHDIDVRSAGAGERVGLALKGVELDELTRGQRLAEEGTLAVATTLVGTDGRRSPYYRGDVGPGAQLQALVGTQLVPASVTALAGPGITVETDRPVAVRAGERLTLADLSAPAGPRGVGSWRL